jgi:hypothetical protein
MSRSPVPRRFWVTVAVALLGGGLACLTVVWRNWIEALTGFDPDRGSGAAEWAVVVALLMSSSVALLIARAEWRRFSVAGVR